MHIFVNRRVAAAAAAALLGLLTALPAAPASASGGSATYAASWLPSTEVEQLLGQLPLGSLPIGTGPGAISPEALIEALEGLPAFSGLESEELVALQKTLEGLGSGATLEILQNPGSLSSGLEATLEGLLGGLGGLGEPLGGGESAEQITQELEKALTEVGIEEVLSGLLSSSQNPAALLEELLVLLPIEQILGHSLGGSPVSAETLEELAEELGMTREELASKLASELGESTEELETTGEALTTGLSNGEVLTVVDGAEKLAVGTLNKLDGLLGGNEETGKETNEETGKETEKQESKEKETIAEKQEKETVEKETASNKEAADSGSGGTQVTVNLPPTASRAAVTKAKRKTTGKLMVLRHSVHAGVATIVVRTPSAGRITAHNRDIRTVSRRVGRARKLTFAVELSKAGIASLTHRRRAHTLRLRIVFRPTHGLRSHVILKLRFR